MEITPDEINGLVERSSEGLSAEIKGWISPSSQEGISKLIKAIFALRNRNGGFLLIGFDDKTLRPDVINSSPVDVRQAFHADVIQGIVSKYASEPFEVRIGFGGRDGKDFPVIKIQEGVRSPVAVSRDLPNGSGGYLIRVGDVFFRTLSSNGTASSAKARPEDWPAIVEICFENREADIGRFVRRHLSGKDITVMIEALTGLRTLSVPPVPTLRDRAEATLAEGEKRFHAALLDRSLTKESIPELNRGMWQIALVVDPPKVEALADQSFLNVALNSNPQLNGWPIWLDSRGFADRTNEPYILEKGWQALIVSLNGGWSRHLDFMRLDPKGEFYLQRIMQDDLTDKVVPETALDGVLAIIRIAEAIIVGLKMVRALGWGDDARLGFAFRWSKLKGRELSSWANPLVGFMPGLLSHTDTVETFVEIPASTPTSAVAPYVEEAMRDLFLAFKGKTLSSNVFEEWTQRLLERRL